MRIEKDFLGEVEIEDSRYYGVQTVRAMSNFPITGQKIRPEMITALAQVKYGCAVANMETGRMDQTIGNALVQACQEILDGKMRDEFPTDCIQGGAGTSINMNMNEVITNRALEILDHPKGRYDIISPNNHANMAQSTNDAFPSAVRLTVLELTDQLLAELSATKASFEKKAEEFQNAIKMGRTHLQDAVPITLGQEFLAYACATGRAIRRIKNASENFLSLNMGATAVGTGLNAEPEFITKVVDAIAKLTDRPFYPTSNLVDATQNTDEVAEFSSALKVSALSFTKIANDLRLMASGPKCGFFEIQLPPRQPGSSIMPGKVNPVMCEVLNQTCFQIIGNDLTVTMAVENGQLELNVMEPVMVFRLFDSISIFTNVLRVFRELCLNGIIANTECCQNYVDNSFGICTALLPYVGYESISVIVKEAQKSGRPVRELILEKGMVTEAELNIILDAQNMTTPGISGKEQVDALCKCK